MSLLKRFFIDDRAVAVAEYGLLAAVAGVAIAVASLAFGSAVKDALDTPVACTAAARC